ncbi:MAG: glycosyltransferase family 4 protein [Sediminibacterium sp.]|nr:glycosyltransferase family 4 protein [Sediminibacterium sp.]
MKKIAIIIQRYGQQVNGGAEVYARNLAHELAEYYDVDVLTTCAKDYVTWAPFFQKGIEQDGKVRVHRFENSQRGSKSELRYSRKKLSRRLWWQWITKKLGLLAAIEHAFPSLAVQKKDHDAWLRFQGPFTPSMMEYIREHQNAYQGFIFFTLLYYTACKGLELVGHRSILVPTLHDEKAMYYPYYGDYYNSARNIFFLTKAESLIANKLFHSNLNSSTVVGAGVKVPEVAVPSKDWLLEKGIHKPYLIYIGRVDHHKGTDDMIRYFQEFNASMQLSYQLVVVGAGKAPSFTDNAQVICTGFIDEDVKWKLLKGAQMLIMPSRYESLSLVLLEAMAYGKPVLANQLCDVLAEHIRNSEGGATFTNATDFSNGLKGLLLDEDKYQTASIQASNYVRTQYSWDTVTSHFRNCIDLNN